MTVQERIQAIVDHGFTERQARFLELVMRHAGLCVKRQYAAFAGVANGGEKCNGFFDKLVRRGFAVTADCIHNRARLYHVHHRQLYHAIGEPDSRYRRAVPARLVAERLMRLDAALLSPDLDWLTIRSEKLAYLRAITTSDGSGQPANASGEETPEFANQFPGAFPIGTDPSGHVTLLYLATVPWTDDFRTFLIGHTALLGVAPAWTLRVVFPQPLRRALPAYEGVVHEELGSPLQSDTIQHLKHWFFHRRRGTDLNAIPATLRATLTRRAQVFSGPRFAHLYRRWLVEDEAALRPISPMIQEALASGCAKMECVVLSHSYEHLSPLANRRRARCRVPRPWEEKGEQTPRSINPFLNPVP